MDIKLANEIVSCLPKDRTLFPYFEDRYARLLLEQFIGDEMAISDIKSSPFAKLLNKPAIKKVVASKGNGRLGVGDFPIVGPSDIVQYVLTLGLWGWKQHQSWSQTSRKGANLVLQLNFSGQHDGAYRQLVDPHDDKPYVYNEHPVCNRNRNTLAWARLDLDFDTGEALIEEVQNDWLRRAACDLRDARAALYQCRDGSQNDVVLPRNPRVRALDVIHYVEQVLAPHYRFWSDAMLSAAIWFLNKEIGIHRIWYHDHDSGIRLKKIYCDKPPRSIYTDLPKRFCFERTTQPPAFLARGVPKKFKRRLKNGQEDFWCLNL